MAFWNNRRVLLTGVVWVSRFSANIEARVEKTGRITPCVLMLTKPHC